jgi:AcrR family transcriptional regulator
MPITVDHEARRAALAAIAADIIASKGIEAATVRAIAEAAGSSTKVVSHYFSDKRALLMATYRSATQDTADRAEATQPPGQADVGAYLLALLPASDPMVRNWKVWLAFWAYATSDEAFAREQRSQVLNARARVETLLGADPRVTGLDADARARAARDLLTLVIGVSLQAAFDPDDWAPSRQYRPIIERIRSLVGRPYPRASGD